MRVVVVGGSGFIGSRLARRLKRSLMLSGVFSTRLRATPFLTLVSSGMRRRLICLGMG